MNIDDNAVKSMMSDIYDLNPEVYKNIVNKNKISTMEYNDLLEIKKRLKATKVSINPKMLFKDNTEKSGCKEELIRTYNSLVMEDIEEVTGRIVVNGKGVEYDITVVRVVKSLLLVGITKNEELANECRDIVQKILVLGTSSNYVTQKQTVERLTINKDKPVGIRIELMKGILEVLK